MIPASKTALSDIETTAITYSKGGVMILPSKVHLITAKDHERQTVHVFGPSMDSLLEGVDYLERSETVVFHNGIGFDKKVLTKYLNLKVRDDWHIIDSLLLCQLFYSNVKEEEDYARKEKHEKRPDSPLKFTGDLVGKHALEAWGLRLRTPVPKMDYVGMAKRLGIEDPWAEWSELMQEYAIQDVVTLDAIWGERLKEKFHASYNRDAILVEHQLAELMEDIKVSGIKFDKEHALKFVEELEIAQGEVAEQIQEEFPPRLEPSKWVNREIPENFPDLTDDELREYLEKRASEKEEDIIRCREIMTSGPRQILTPIMKERPKNVVYRPRFNLPPGYLREQWGEVFVPKMNRAVVNKAKEVMYHAVKGSEYVKCEWKELNPGSRPQITRRLLEIGWKPEEFTETGNPSLSEDELLKIEELFPIASSLVKYLLIQKRLGAVKGGDKAWLKLLDENGFIHPTIRSCNTVTFRASHSDPNVSQVTSVKMRDVLDKDGNKTFKEVEKVRYDFVDNKWRLTPVGTEKKILQEPRKGEDGKWGWESRACFTVPEDMLFIGTDLAGIELRAWAHYLWKFDGGRFADVVLNKDVHEENRVILQFDDRRKAKEWLYAAMYGAGDPKLGSIIEPLASLDRQKALGETSRSRLMAGLLGYEELNTELMHGVRRGYLKGLDGRRCPVRKKHAALNTLLQSCGAIVAKYWTIFTMDIIETEHKLRWGYDKDFTLMIWSHDELDFAARPEFEEPIVHAATEGAKRAEQYLGFRLPVEIGVNIGKHWGEAH